MTTPTVLPFDVLSPHRAQIGESPLWSVAEQCLYWVDIEGRTLKRFECAAKRHSHIALSERAGSIDPRQGGGVLTAMDTGIFHLTQGPIGALGTERTHP